MSKFLTLTRTKGFIIIAALVFLGLLVVEYNQVTKMRKVQKEIDELVKQEEYYNKLNEQMKDSISSYDSQFYKEKVAREELNLKKPGEQVYSYTTTEDAQVKQQQEIQTAQARESSASSSEVSNQVKWWNYFFNPEI